MQPLAVQGHARTLVIRVQSATVAGRGTVQGPVQSVGSSVLARLGQVSASAVAQVLTAGVQGVGLLTSRVHLVVFAPIHLPPVRRIEYPTQIVYLRADGAIQSVVPKIPVSHPQGYVVGSAGLRRSQVVRSQVQRYPYVRPKP